jgi:periplasmic protein CpxP/Spy
MKKLIIAAVLCIGFAGSGFAQEMNKEKEVKTPEERAKMMTEMMDKKLALTPDQKSKVYDLNLERANKMERMRAADQKERTKKLEEHKELMLESDKKMQRILNDTQRKTYDEMKAKRMDMKGHHNMKHNKMMKKN